VSEIEFRTPYVVAERWIVARMLRFMHAKNVHSDTLSICPRNRPASGRLWRLPSHLASERKCYPPASPCKARTPCGVTATHYPGRCTVGLIFSEGNGRSKENEGENEGNQDLHGDQPIGLWGLTECHRRGRLGNFRSGYLPRGSRLYL
jgi:hypothetical protein